VKIVNQKSYQQKVRDNMRYYGIRSGINNPTNWALRHSMSYGGGGCMTFIVQVAVVACVISCMIW
jgi:hypothetical protein